jgi:hypothetical protein
VPPRNELSNVDACLASFLGGYRLTSFAFKPAQGTQGGILILLDANYIELQNIQVASFSISASVKLILCGSIFRLPTVYGPLRREHNQAFLNHLRSLSPNDNSKWLIVGDFNLIYKAKDKNN